MVCTGKREERENCRNIIVRLRESDQNLFAHGVDEISTNKETQLDNQAAETGRTRARREMNENQGGNEEILNQTD